MATASNKVPPQLSNFKSYNDWVRVVKIWTRFTDLEKKKQGPAIVMSLSGKALEAILELEDAAISADDGVKSIITKLDTLYKKDELNEKFQDLENFESFRRSSDISLQQFIVDFDHRYNRIKRHGTTISNDLLGFKLLKAASLTLQHEQLIKATIPHIDYEIIKEKIKSVFSNELGNSETAHNNMQIKTEPIFLTKEHTSEEDGEYENIDDSDSNDEQADTYYTSTRTHKNIKYKQKPSHSQSKSKHAYYHTPQYSNTKENWNTKRSKGKNPLRNGYPTRCNICQSINHWASQCPDKNLDEVTYMVHEVILQLNSDVILQALLSETWCSAILDSGASSTVCGKVWFDEYTKCLPPDDIASINYIESSKPFRFGDGKKLISERAAIIPANIGPHKISIKTDIIESNIPLLLSKAAMKKAQMQLDFQNDRIIFRDDCIPLDTTSNGLYSLPLTKPKSLMNELTHDTLKGQIVLSVTQEKTDKEIAIKLHRSFGHPSVNKLLQLIDNSGKRWSSNENLKKEIRRVTEHCKICKIYKKPPPRPVVSLPMATQFQETVAMDLKYYQGRHILHLIDLCTRLSAATFIPNKNRDTIIKEIFHIWIAVYGSPKKFLTDNGGEFANADFMEMCDCLGIMIQTTAAESPWSNGIVERNNQTLSTMMDKIIADTNCSPDLALAWALNAKNSLHNVAGFSPFQLVLGQNPNLPSTLSDNLPALSIKPSAKIIQENLNTLHSARAAFISTENDERIRRALTHNVRTSLETKYITGDQVLYKRNNSNEWRGPGIVIGQVNQQVFVKHGSYYIRIHPCRIQLVKSTTRIADYDTRNNNVTQSEKESPNNSLIENSTIRRELINSESEGHQPMSAEESQSESESYSAEETDNSLNTDKLLKLKPNTPICYKLTEDSSWINAHIINRAGKATGKYHSWWNVQNEDGSSHSIDLNRINKLELLGQQTSSQSVDRNTEANEDILATDDDDDDDERIFNAIYLAQSKADELTAKKIELDQWKYRKVYNEIEDSGQECISLRWVIKTKLIDNKQTTKARLCARGFEEEQNYRTDSPTCTREGIRMTLALIASKKWDINSIDVKTAFLQGKELERTVLVRPPKEAATNKIWKLNKCVYGLADASRYWYLKVREELCKLGGKTSKLDQGIFYFNKGQELIGVVALFVDDLLWAGNSTVVNIISKFKKIFNIGSENHKSFTYIGINLKQNDNKSITVDQSTYTQSIQTIELTREQNIDPYRKVTEKERSSIRKALGQLNWLSNISRPEISYQVSNISSRIKEATISDIKEINKLIKFVKENKGFITFPSLHIPSIKIVMYSDASFNNLPNGASQGAHIIMLKDKNNQSCPLTWKSTKVRRIARSTLAAETLAFADGSETSYLVHKIAQESNLIMSSSPILAYTDSKSLCESVNTTSLISDRRLRVEISAIREMKDKGEIEIQWISNQEQLADCLTKKGASCKLIMSVLQNGNMH